MWYKGSLDLLDKIQDQATIKLKILCWLLFFIYAFSKTAKVQSCLRQLLHNLDQQHCLTTSEYQEILSRQMPTKKPTLIFSSLWGDGPDRPPLSSRVVLQHTARLAERL